MRPDVAFSRLLRCVLPEEQPPRTLAVVAHPDDETAGFGGAMTWLAPSLSLAYLTDGAPRDMQDATRLGFTNPEQYASARSDELRCALRLVGIGSAQVEQLAAPDKEAVCSLPRLVHAVERLIASRAPELILTHAYEGGHPDHDAAAFVVQRAIERIAARGGAVPAVAEFATYHRADGGGWRWGFAPGARVAELSVVLDPPRREAKERLLACFVTQRGVLAGVPRDAECFRPAPHYDFTRGPQSVRPLYDDFGWWVTSATWREHARAADAVLGVRSRWD